MTLSTKVFKKRFHMLSIPAKMDVVAAVKKCLDERKMPSGNDMNGPEAVEIYELLTWCDKNIFFDTTPSKWDAPKD